MSVLFAGLGMFFSLASLAYLNRSARRPGIDRFINLILLVALTGEGFFMGYLAFQIHTLCIFCVIVFGFMVTLGALRALSGERGVLAGFAALAAVFLLQYAVLPAGVTVTLPENDRLILFYSDDCRHCTEIKQELEEQKMAVAHLQAGEYAAFLKNIGIDGIPTLMVNDRYQKTFLTGKDAIRRYLLACSKPEKTVGEPASKTQAPGRDEPAEESPGAAVDIFNQPGLLTLPGPSPAEDGMCKEAEVCE
jgi:hypothetical protein